MVRGLRASVDGWRGGLRPPLAIPPLAPRTSTRRDAGLRADRTPAPARCGRQARPGASTATTSAPRCGRPGASRSGQRDQRAGRDDHACTGTACTCRPRWTAARTSDRAGRHLVAVVDDRPAGRDPLVPPAPARRDRATTSTGAWPGCSSSTTRTRGRRRAAARLRRRRHPGDRAGPAFDDDDARPRAVPRRHRHRSATRLLVNGTLGPYLDVTTERVRLRLLNASNARFYDFGLRRRPPVRAGRHRRRAAARPVET